MTNSQTLAVIGACPSSQGPEAHKSDFQKKESVGKMDFTLSARTLTGDTNAESLRGGGG